MDLSINMKKPDEHGLSHFRIHREKKTLSAKKN